MDVDVHIDSAYEAPGPVLNYCPTCGATLIDRRAFGRIRRYCETCARVVFREHKVAVALLVTDAANKILLVRRALPPSRGLWSLPAGFVDYGEAPVDAARRECLEETGLVVQVGPVVEVIANREHGRGADIVIIYEGTVVDGSLMAADDAEAACFFSPEDLPSLAFQSTHQAVAQWWSRADAPNPTSERADE